MTQSSKKFQPRTPRELKFQAELDAFKARRPEDIVGSTYGDEDEEPDPSEVVASSVAETSTAAAAASIDEVDHKKRASPAVVNVEFDEGVHRRTSGEIITDLTYKMLRSQQKKRYQYKHSRRY